MDYKVNKILTDTETLLHQYRQKINLIGKDLVKIETLKEQINSKIDGFHSKLDAISSNCDHNHSRFSEHVDSISLRFSETTVDLKSASEGFHRELERMNHLFREL